MLGSIVLKDCLRLNTFYGFNVEVRIWFMLELESGLGFGCYVMLLYGCCVMLWWDGYSPDSGLGDILC